MSNADIAFLMSLTLNVVLIWAIWRLARDLRGGSWGHATGCPEAMTSDIDGPAGEADNLIEPVAWLDRAANGSISHVLLSKRAAAEFELTGHKLEPLVPASALDAYQAKVGELERVIEAYRASGASGASGAPDVSVPAQRLPE